MIQPDSLSRRAFLAGGSLLLLTGAVGYSEGLPFEEVSSRLQEPALRIGLITDVHYADVPERGTRFYRDSREKMEKAVDALNRQKVDCTIEMGDLIDAKSDPDAASELQYLRHIDRAFSRLKAPRHYVAGNHCIYSLTKAQFLDTIQRKRFYYSFDMGAYHLVILDACFRRDGVEYGRRNNDWTDTDIPPAQKDWLHEDLKATTRKTLVFIHQRLDLPQGSQHNVHTAPEVRSILEKSGKVAAVFQGHHHVNDYREVGGIHYCTLNAMVDGEGNANNAYSTLQVFSDGSLKLEGFYRHSNHPLTKGTRG